MEDYSAWVEQVCPEDIRARGLSYGGGTKNRMPGEAFKRWFDACVERGFTVPEWPVAYGGAGLDRSCARALADAMRVVGAPPPLLSLGTNMLGSTTNMAALTILFRGFWTSAIIVEPLQGRIDDRRILMRVAGKDVGVLT